MKIDNITDYETIKGFMNEEEIDDQYKAIFLSQYFIDNGYLDKKEIFDQLKEIGIYETIDQYDNIINDILENEISFNDLITVFYENLNQEFSFYSCNEYLDLYVEDDLNCLPQYLRYHFDYAGYLRDQAINNEIDILKVGCTLSIFEDLTNK